MSVSIDLRTLTCELQPARNGRRRGVVGSRRWAQCVVTVHSSTGDVTRNEEYYALSHASRFVRVGAQRVTSRGGDSTLSHVAFLNPDGSRTLILVNEHREARAIPVVDRGRRWLVALPGRAVATVTWPE